MYRYSVVSSFWFPIPWSSLDCTGLFWHLCCTSMPEAEDIYVSTHVHTIRFYYARQHKYVHKQFLVKVFYLCISALCKTGRQDGIYGSAGATTQFGGATTCQRPLWLLLDFWGGFLYMKGFLCTSRRTQILLNIQQARTSVQWTPIGHNGTSRDSTTDYWSVDQKIDFREFWHLIN